MKRVSCGSCKRHTPWLSGDIMAAIHKKHKAKHVAEKTGDAADFLKYRERKNSLKLMVRSAKLAYLQGLPERSYKFSHIAVKLWSQVNEVIGRQHVSKLTNVGGNLSLDKINSFFVLWPSHLIIILPAHLFHHQHL